MVNFLSLILQGNGIKIVVQQLSSPEGHIAIHAAGIVANLAACNQAAYHDSLERSGALAPLLQLLKCPPPEQAAALSALRNLTANMKWQVS